MFWCHLSLRSLTGNARGFLKFVLDVLKQRKWQKDWPHQVLILGPSTRRVDVIPLHHKARWWKGFFFSDESQLQSYPWGEHTSLRAEVIGDKGVLASEKGEWAQAKHCERKTKNTPCLHFSKQIKRQLKSFQDEGKCLFFVVCVLAVIELSSSDKHAYKDAFQPFSSSSSLPLALQ